MKYIRKWLWAAYMPIAVIYLELVFRFICMGKLSALGLCATVAFSAAAGLLISATGALCGAKAYRAVTGVLLALVTLLFGVQTVYRGIFRTTLGVGLLGNAGNAVEGFGREAAMGILASLPKLLLLLLPLVLWLIFSGRLVPGNIGTAWKVALPVLFAVIQFAAVLGVRLDRGGALSLSFYYGEGFVLDAGTETFGLLTAQRLDIQSLFGGTDPVVEPEDVPRTTPRPVPTPEQSIEQPVETPSEFVPRPQVLDIDFAALYEAETDQTAKSLHSFFASREPTYTNEYTGIFRGKNLIWICAEGFSPWAVDPVHTPTLDMLCSSGFVFENFYCPLTGASTTGGEFITLTALMQASSKQLMKRTGTRYMPYGMGNLLNPLGYTSIAYHNGQYTFYGRDISHPNLGYDFRANGRGIELTEPGLLPTSDLDMMQATVSDYVDCEHFNIYYMTISGHMAYSFGRNAMCARYRSQVQDLEGYTEAAKAYVACNMDFDRAMEHLLSRLEDAGKLDDTVIVISPDHYPYGLETKDLESMSGGKIDTEFDTVHSTLIIYSGCMEEPVYIDKVCSSIDILPTIMNLFGIEYDSRIIMGRDILSSAPGFVAFPTYSFLTDFGRYNGRTGEFTAYDEDYELPEGYVQDTVKLIRTMYKYSEEVINCDYYSRAMPKEG